MIRATLSFNQLAGQALSRMRDFIAEVVFCAVYVLSLSFVGLVIYQLDQVGVVNLSVLNDLPEWLVDTLFFALIVFVIFLYRLVWKKAKLRFGI